MTVTILSSLSASGVALITVDAKYVISFIHAFNLNLLIIDDQIIELENGSVEFSWFKKPR
jgi:hypothetical protein